VQDKLDHYNRKIARLLRMPGDKVHITGPRPSVWTTDLPWT
jgi:hypothetical protein